MEKLVSWIRENGGYVDEDIYMEEITKYNRTLKVKKDKLVETKLVDIPEKCCIKGKNQMVISLLLYREFEKGESSFYFPYLEILPKTEDLLYHPLYKYTKQDVEPIYKICEEAGFMLHNILRDMEVFMTSVKNKELGKRCFVLSLTRSWDIGMIPILDLVQHNFPPNSAVNQRTLTSKGVQAGQELVHVYRMASHIDLYMTFGIGRTKINFLRLPVSVPNSEQPVYFLFPDKDFILKTLEQAKSLTTGLTEPLHQLSSYELLINILHQAETKYVADENYSEINSLNQVSKDVIQNSLKFLNEISKKVFTFRTELLVGPSSE